MPKSKKKTTKKAISRKSRFVAERERILKEMISKPPTEEELITRENFLKGLNGPTEPPFG